jgi:hypothetical protein
LLTRYKIASHRKTWYESKITKRSRFFSRTHKSRNHEHSFEIRRECVHARTTEYMQTNKCNTSAQVVLVASRVEWHRIVALPSCYDVTQTNFLEYRRPDPNKTRKSCYIICYLTVPKRFDLS